MDLWIRNQSKAQLIKIDDIHINDTQIWGNTHWLGDYETKERALEVLNEIQKLLMGQDKMVFKNTGLDNKSLDELYNRIAESNWVGVLDDAKVEYIAPSTIVYEMPEK